MLRPRRADELEHLLGESKHVFEKLRYPLERGCPVNAAASDAPARLKVGDVAPDFDLGDQHLQRVRLSDFHGHRNVLLVFYPMTFTSVCGGELTAIRDRLPEFDAQNVTVLGISADSSAVHRAFVDREYLGFPLLSDFWPHGEAARAYGVFNETTGLAERATFLIDTTGVVRWTVDSEMSTPRSTQDYLTAAASLEGSA